MTLYGRCFIILTSYQGRSNEFASNTFIILFHFLTFPRVAVGDGDGSDLSMEVLQNGQVTFKLAYNTPGLNKLKSKGDSLKVTIDESINLTVVGDTKIRFHSTNGVNIFLLFIL